MQAYSAKSDRMITKFILIHTEIIGEDRKNETVLETYKLHEVVQTLAEIYRGVDE